MGARGAVDLAIALHRRGDQAMLQRMRAADLSNMAYRDKVIAALRMRLEELPDREAVRRATTLFSLPNHAADGAKLVWETADNIWTALDDTSRDGNWYSKRATLSAVYSSTVLFWLGDTSEGHAETWAFLDRRIENVMQIEKVKAQVNSSPTLSMLMAGPNWLLSHVKAPSRLNRSDLPGSWGSPRP